MAIAFVVSTSAVAVAGGAITTPAIDTSGANFLVATVDAFNGVNPIGNVTDSKGNTWANLTTHVSNGGNVSGFIAYVKNATVGSGHTFSFGTTATFPGICVAAYSGVDVTAPFDQQNGADNVAASTGQPGTITPSAAGALVIACAQYLDATNVASVNGSFILQENQASDATATHVGSSLAYLIQTSAAAANPTFTATAAGSSRQWLGIASFLAATGGATTWGPLLGLQNNRLIFVQ